MSLKIAVIFNQERKDTTGKYFKQALEKMQHRVNHYWTKDAENIDQDYDLYLRIDHGDYKYDLPPYLKPQVFFAIDTHLKKPFKKIVKQARHYDLVFTAQKDGVRALRWRGIKAEWLPLACDLEIHKKMELPKTYDIAFVGTEGKKSLRGVLLKDLSRRYPNSFLGRAPFTDLGRIYSAAKIGFNYSIKNDINMRIFEVMSCGTFLLTNRIKGNGFRELFEEGKNLIVYRNPKELFRLIDYYLNHNSQREQIAKQGYQLVASRHTYQKRTNEMLNCIKENLADRYPRLKALIEGS